MALEKTSSTTALPTAQRLGRNQGRYLGETIDLEAVLDELRVLAFKHGWRTDCFYESDPSCWLAFHRTAANQEKRLYISAGIHGDEPAGPLAVLELVRQNQWPDRVEVWLCPCLNPSGFPLNTRENAGGLDLNRQYHQPEAPETRAHIGWLEQQPSFDVTLCLHEDWEAHGFYVYEIDLDNQHSLGGEIIRNVAPVCPIDLSAVIEGREAHGGIIQPSIDPASRPQWPEAFYLVTHKTRRSCTLEAPSDFPLKIRVAALVAGARAVLEVLGR